MRQAPDSIMEGNEAMEHQTSKPIFPPINQDTEATDANPVPLSPTDPKRRTSEGDTAPPERKGASAIRAVASPLTIGNVFSADNAGSAAVPSREDGEAPVDNDLLRPDSEGAV
jgi:hypothetical protein